MFMISTGITLEKIKQEEIELEPPLSARQIFADLLLEYIYQWAKQGFMLDYDWYYSDIPIAIYMPYVKGSMEYISSGIINYADRNRPVRIVTGSKDNVFFIYVQGSIESEELNGVYIRANLEPVSAMMKKMKGEYEIQIHKKLFRVTLNFPIA